MQKGDRVRFKKSSPVVDRTKTWTIELVNGSTVVVSRCGEQLTVNVSELELNP